jgi:hypothetical protein
VLNIVKRMPPAVAEKRSWSLKLRTSGPEGC